MKEPHVKGPGSPAPPFSGSYDPEDAVFLLKVIELPPLDIMERERRVQSGESHYSEMIGPEAPPDEEYLRIFRKSLERNIERLALDFLKLASCIALLKKGPLVLVSIARSGTPAGVVLGRLLRGLFSREVRHYSISVIRDRGVDKNALRHLAEAHAPGSLVFVDGWTGKGGIARELQKSVSEFNLEEGLALDTSLAVLSDPAGAAGLSVGTDDYLIPTCLLNSVVSGLVSRTILNASRVGPLDYHGCLFYENLREFDISKSLADEIEGEALRLSGSLDLSKDWRTPPEETLRAARESRAFMERTAERFGVKDENHIKPGLGEATRVLLRRAPELLMLKDLDDPDAEHALFLAKERGVPVEETRDLPYRAAAIIKKLR